MSVKQSISSQEDLLLSLNKEKKIDAYGGVALDLADDGEGAGAGIFELGVDGELAGLGAFYKVCPWQCGRLCC